jgi:hypothetical protein
MNKVQAMLKKYLEWDKKQEYSGDVKPYLVKVGSNNAPTCSELINHMNKSSHWKCYGYYSGVKIQAHPYLEFLNKKIGLILYYSPGSNWLKFIKFLPSDNNPDASIFDTGFEISNNNETIAIQLNNSQSGKFYDTIEARCSSTFANGGSNVSLGNRWGYDKKTGKGLPPKELKFEKSNQQKEYEKFVQDLMEKTKGKK